MQQHNNKIDRHITTRLWSVLYRHNSSLFHKMYWEYRGLRFFINNPMIVFYLNVNKVLSVGRRRWRRKLPCPARIASPDSNKY